MAKLVVNIEKFLNCNELMDKINSTKVEDLVIEINGHEIIPSQATIDDFKNTGLDNLDFIKMALYIEEKED